MSRMGDGGHVGIVSHPPVVVSTCPQANSRGFRRVDRGGEGLYSFAMAKWIPGDVLEWREPDWHTKGRVKKTYFKKGERLVIAQVVKVDKSYVQLEVLRCEIVFDQSARGVKVLKTGEGIKRKVTKLKSREAVRRPWGGKDGERARAKVTSKFLRN